MKLRLAFITIMGLGLSACTTISRGSTDYLRIDTVPQGATVTTNILTRESREKSLTNILAKKEYRGCAPTPCLLEVGRRQTFSIKIEHPGYEPAEIAINGEIPLQMANIDMAVPAGSAAANLGIGIASGALVGSVAVVYSQMFYSIFTLGSVQAPTSGIVAGATAAGAGVGVAMIGVDVMSGSFENVYPNPVIIKLAPEGSPTLTDPNMLVLRLKEAKKQLSRHYCKDMLGVSRKRQEKNCEIAKQRDAQRAIENAELLANEQAIKDMIKTLKQQLRDQAEAARKARQSQ